jgi:hypothetical protein
MYDLVELIDAEGIVRKFSPDVFERAIEDKGGSIVFRSGSEPFWSSKTPEEVRAEVNKVKASSTRP